MVCEVCELLHVLALAQLENVLFAVDDFERPVGQPLACAECYEFTLNDEAGSVPMSPLCSQPSASSASAVCSASLHKRVKGFTRWRWRLGAP